MTKRYFTRTIATLLSATLVAGQVFAQQATTQAAAPVVQPPAAAPVTQPPAAAPATPTVAAGTASDWQQEFALWQAAANGNTIDEYQSYLTTYPNGKFAAIAQARIVKLSTTEEDRTPKAAAAPAVIETTAAVQPAPQPVAPEPPPLSLGTPDTEAALLSQRTTRAEVQGRLTALGFNTGGTDGVLGQRSRTAISQWQTVVSAPATGFLSYDQLARLRADSEITYTNWLASRPKPPVRRVVRTEVVERDNSAADAAIALGIMGLAAGVIGGVAAGRHHGGPRFYRPGPGLHGGGPGPGPRHR